VQSLKQEESSDSSFSDEEMHEADYEEFKQRDTITENPLSVWVDPTRIT